jgi:putative tricarboxylic transport membrane protein
MVLAGLLSVLTWETFFFVIIGVVIGIIFGCIPGLTSNMAVALCLPLTYKMTPILGISTLMALFVGGMSGGLISAILINIPGTPSSVATCFDGAPLARKGEAGKALGVGIMSSFLGTILSIGALIFIAPALARFALKFGPHEYFSITVFALTMLGSLLGDSVLLGLSMAILGICVSLVGMAPVGGVMRFTFGFFELSNGLNILPVLIGLFAISEIFNIATSKGGDSSETEVVSYKLKGLGFKWKEVKGQWLNFLRSALIGIGIGILPGIGGGTSNIVAYSVAKSQSKYPEKFGTGIIDGVVASETANNASIGGAMIPLLTLGIPGDTVTAMLLGGLMIHGISPGPLLFKNSGVFVYGLFFSFILATIAIVILEYAGLRLLVKILKVPKYIMLPAIMALCCVGSFGLNNRIFDVMISLIMGVVGFAMIKLKLPLPPFLLGFILGPIIELNLIRALMYSKNDWSSFIRAPISAVFLILSFVVIGMTVCSHIRKKRILKNT